MDEVFKALADRSRRHLLDSLNERDGQNLSELCAELSLARQSVSKHLAVLETANLVTVIRRGRERLHHLNTEPINAIADRWINRYDRPLVETSPDPKMETATDEFVYVTYIRTTPERLWQAITNPVFSRSYLGHAIESDWQKGSTYAWVEDGLRIEHPDQVILESDAYQRLVFTFHSAERFTDAAAEQRSRVSLDIQPTGDQIKLTVIHDGFAPDSAVYQLISQAWPLKLSGLKSELELAAHEASALGGPT